MVKSLPVSSGDVRDKGSTPGSGRSPGAERGGLLFRGTPWVRSLLGSDPLGHREDMPEATSQAHARGEERRPPRKSQPGPSALRVSHLVRGFSGPGGHQETTNVTANILVEAYEKPEPKSPS